MNYINYINAEHENSQNMLLKMDHNTVNNQISSDLSFNGVSYVPQDECPVGFKRVGDKCHKVCNHCGYKDVNGLYGIPYSKIGVIRDNYHQKKYTFGDIDGSGFIKLIMF